MFAGAGSHGAEHAARAVLRQVVARVLEEYALDPLGLHGVGHWARVLENGRRLARATGANLRVVELFAVLHDACRRDEGCDPGHGDRAAALAASWNGNLFRLSAEEMEDLQAACAGHSRNLGDGNATVHTCWDADRLDLGRVGIRPDPARLSTAAARSRGILTWATRRGIRCEIPRWVHREWGVGSR